MNKFKELSFGIRVAFQSGTMWRILSSKQGVTLVELIVVMSIIGIIALFGAPEIMRFVSDYKARSCATDLIQNMRIAKSMALKENRQYLITFDTSGKKYRTGFDGSSPSDGDLLDSVDGFGTDVNGPGTHGPVRVVDFQSQYGGTVDYGTLAPASSLPGDTCTNGKACFGGSNQYITFNRNGSIAETGSVYIMHTLRGFSYCVSIVNFSGSMNMWKWNGDEDNLTETTWTELR
jgi:prepilin-type N-terminal cleavage/methylation domain-containing protein